MLDSVKDSKMQSVSSFNPGRSSATPLQQVDSSMNDDIAMNNYATATDSIGLKDIYMKTSKVNLAPSIIQIGSQSLFGDSNTQNADLPKGKIPLNKRKLSGVKSRQL